LGSGAGREHLRVHPQTLDAPVRIFLDGRPAWAEKGELTIGQDARKNW
jgi:hypothetical protein